ncbi:hypothetical protein ACLIYP_16105 [Streptomyces nanhaiensis]
MPRRGESIAVAGYKSIRATELILGPITVLVGIVAAGRVDGVTGSRSPGL